MTGENNLNVKIVADVSDYKRDMQGAKQATKEFGNESKSSSSKVKQLEATIAAQKAKLKTLKAEYANLTSSQNKSTTSTKELEAKMKLLNTQLAVNEQRLSIATAANKAFSTSMDASGAQQTNISMEELGQTLANIRSLSIADIFVSLAAALALTRKHSQLAASNFKNFAEEVRDAFNFKDMEFDNFTELFANMKIQGKEALSSLGMAFKNLGKTIQSVTSSAAFQMAKLLAVVLAITGAVKAGLSTSERLTNSFYEAQKIGMSNAAYEEWAYILGQVGVEADKLSDFFKTLAAAQNDVRDGSEDIVEAFNKLGLSAEEVSNMTQEALFTETVKRLQQMENQIERTAIAYRLFGEDDAAQLTNILNLNNQEMERMVNNFYLLGGSASDSAIQKSRMLQNSVSNLRLAWQGFVNTIGEAVMPALTAIVNALVKAVVAVNMFLRAVFGFSIVSKGTKANVDSASASVGGYTDNIKKATSAAEKLKRTTQGFDELNIVNDPNSAGGGGDFDAGGGGGGAIDIPEMDFEALTQDLGLEEMAAWFEKNADDIQKWTTRVVAATAAWKLFTAAVKLFTGTKITFGTLLAGLPKLAGWLGTVIALLKEGNSFWAVMGAAFPKLAGVISSIGTAFAGVGTAVKGALAAIGGLVGGGVGAGLAIVAAVVAAVASAVYFLWKNWDGVVQAVKNFFAQNIAPKFEKIGQTFKELWEAVKKVGDAFATVGKAIWNALPQGLKDWLAGVVEGIGKVIKAIGEWLASVDWLKAIGEVFEWLGGFVVGILGGVLGGAINGVVQLIVGASEIITGIVEIIAGIVSGLINLIVGLFTGDFTKALDAAKMIWDGIVNVFKGAYDATIGVVVEFVKGIIDWFTELWDVLVGHSIVPDMVEAIIKWFKELPKQLFTMMADFVKKIIDYFKDLAAKAGEWAGTMWKNVKKPFEGTAKWFTDIFKQAWDGITKTWDKVTSYFTQVWNNIKSIFSKVGTSIAEGVSGAVKGAINSVLRSAVGKINTFIGWINSAIGAINKIPGVNIGRIGTLSVPQLATGGIAVSDTLAHIGEGGKREAVLPLDQNTGWMDMLADRLAARVNGGGASKIVLQVGEKELGWATINSINGITKQTGGLQLHLV